MPSHYLNQHWLSASSTVDIKYQYNLKQLNLLQENEFQNVVCNMPAIMSHISAPICLSAHYVPPEITPPTLELCPKDEEVTTSTARTEIEKPRVIFRAEDGREMAHTCTHFGERQFYNFTLGSHVIRCKAFNPMFGEDASSVCQFTLTVKRKDSAVKLTYNPIM